MKYQVLIGFMFALAIAAPVTADCVRNLSGDIVCGKGQCVWDQYGKVFCADKDGGAIKDKYGDVKCGVGYCAKDYLEQVWCSKEPGGGAAVDIYGKVKCLGGCEEGSFNRCHEAR